MISDALTQAELEVERRHYWRIAQFEALGFKDYQAKYLAIRGVDWHEAEDLIDSGCPHRLALKILE